MNHKILFLLALALLLLRQSEQSATQTLKLPTKFNCTFEILETDAEHEDIKNKKYAT